MADDLRDQIAEALHGCFVGQGDTGRIHLIDPESGECTPCEGRADAVLSAVVGPELERLRSWDGLMATLDEHYPPETFDGSSGDPGPRIITLTRELERLRAELADEEYQKNRWISDAAAWERRAEQVEAERDALIVQRDAKAGMLRRVRARHQVHHCKNGCPCEGEGDGRVCGYCQMPWPCPDREDLGRESAADALDLAKEMHRQRQRAEHAEAAIERVRDAHQKDARHIHVFGCRVCTALPTPTETPATT